MANEQPVGQVPTKSSQAVAVKSPRATDVAAVPQEKVANASKPVEPSPKEKLTVEEQMARYEDDLKENDWGHQPC
jgi:hypothetical protein